MRIKFLLPVTVFLAVFGSNLGNIVLSGDSRWMVHTALSIVREGNADLNEYRGEFEFTWLARQTYLANPDEAERLARSWAGMGRSTDQQTSAPSVSSAPASLLADLAQQRDRVML